MKAGINHVATQYTEKAEQNTPHRGGILLPTADLSRRSEALFLSPDPSIPVLHLPLQRRLGSYNNTRGSNHDDITKDGYRRPEPLVRITTNGCALMCLIPNGSGGSSGGGTNRCDIVRDGYCLSKAIIRSSIRAHRLLYLIPSGLSIADHEDED